MAIAFLFAQPLCAATRTSTATGGNWNVGTTWVGGVAPGATDDVVIATTGASSVTVTAGATCVGVVINSGATLMIPAVTFTINGDITINGVWNETGAATINCSGNFTNNATTFTAGSGTHTFSGATKTLGGNTPTSIPTLTFTGSYTNTDVLTVGTALTVTGAAVRLTNNGTITATTALSGTGGVTQGSTGVLNIGGTAGITTLTANVIGNTVNYNGAAQTAKVTTYHNLTISGTLAKTFATTPTVNGVLSMEGTTASVTATVGVVTYGPNATLQYNKTAAFTATAEEWISPFAATGGVIVAGSGVITMGAAKTFNAGVPLAINPSATLTPGANLLTLGGDFSNQGTFTSGSGGVTINGTATSQAIDGFTTTGTITMSKTSGTATFDGNVNGAGLTINGAGGTLDLGAGTHTFTGTMTLSAGTLNGNSSSLNVATNWTNNGGTFTPGTGTVNLNGAAARTLGGTASTSFNILKINNASGVTMARAQSVSVLIIGDVTPNSLLTDGGFQITGSPTGSMSMGVNARLTLGTAGTATLFPTGFTSPNISLDATSTVTYNSNAAQTISSVPTYGNLTLAATAAVIKTMNGDLNINGNLTINNFNTLSDAGNYAIYLAGNWSSATGSGFTIGTGTVHFDGTGAQQITGTLTPKLFYDVAVDKTAGTLTAAAALNIDGDFTMATPGGTFVAGAFTHTVAGNFSVSAGTFTNTGSTISFDGTAAQTVSSNQSFNNLTVAKTAGALTATSALDLAGNFTMATAGGTFVAGSFTHTVAGNVSISAGTFTNTGSTISFDGAGAQSVTSNQAFNNFTVAKTAGTLTATSALNIDGNFTMATAGGTFAAGVFTDNIGGDFIISAGTFTNAGSTISFDGTGAQSVSSTQPFNNLTVAKTAGALTASSALDLAGNFTMATAGGTFVGGSFTHTVAGNVSISAGTFTNTGSTISFDGAGAQGVTSNQAFNNFTVAKTAGTLTATSALNIDGNFAMATAGGTFAAGAFTDNIGGNFAISAGTFTNAGSTISFDGTGAQSVSSTQAFNNFTVAKTSGSLTANSNLDINGNFVMATAGGTFAAGAFTHTIFGNFTISSGSFANAGSTISFDGTGAQTVTSNQSFNNFTVAKTAGTLTASSALNIDGNVLLSTAGGTFAAGGFTHNVGGNWTFNGGTFTAGAGTIAFDGSSQTIGGTVATTFNNLNISAGTTTATTAPTVAATFTISNGAGYVQTTATAVPGATRTFGASSTYTFTNSGATIANISYGNVTINIPSGAMTAAGNLQTVAGTLRIQGTGTGSFTLATTQNTITAIGGSLQVDAGNADFSTGTGAPTVNVSGSVVLNGGTLQPATSTGLPIFNVKGDWTNNGGTFTPGTGTVTFNGTSAQTIGGSSTTTFNNLTLSNTSAAVSANSSFNAGGTLTVSANAVLSPAAATIVGGGGTLTGNGTVKVTKTTATADFSSQYTITGKTLTNLTVEYAGIGEVLSNLTYSNLSISGSITGAAGDATVGGVFKVTATGTFGPTSGTITLNGGSSIVVDAGGIFAMPNLTIANGATVSTTFGFSINGNLTIGTGSVFSAGASMLVTGGVANSGSYTGATLQLGGGSGAHNLSGPGSYSALELNDAFGATLSSDVTVNVSLTLSNGNITTGSNTLVMASGASWVPANGFIVGNLAKYISSGSLSATFDIGDVSPTRYTPVAVTFITVTTPGYLTVSTTSSDHPNISGSNIDATHSANRYWTLKAPTLTGTYDATFNFVAGDLDAGAAPLSFIGEEYSGGAWSFVTVGARTATSTQLAGLVGFGDFQLGAQLGGPFISIASSNWNNPATWDRNLVPSTDADVTIAAGHTVTLDVSTANLKTVTVQGSGVLSGNGSGVLTLGANGGTDFSNDGTVSNLPVKLNKNSQWTGSGVFNLTSIDLNSKTLTLAFGSPNSVHLSGSGDPVSNPGSLVPGLNSTIDFNGTSAQTISASANVNFNNLQLSNSSSVTLAAAITSTKVTGNLSVLAGSFDNGGYAITLANNQSFSLAGGTIMLIGGSSGMVVVSGSGTKTFGASSTVIYSGSGQAVSAEAYGNLALSGSGAKTMPGSAITTAGTFTMSGTASVTAGAAISVAGDFTLNAGASFDAGSFGHSVSGNWMNNGATFNAGTSTITIAGASKVIGGSGTTAFATLTISGSYTINSSITVNPLLTITRTGSMTVAPTVMVTVTGDIQNDGSVTNNGTVKAQ